LKYKIKLIREKDLYPLALLLEADPSIDAISKYIYNGSCFIAQAEQEIIGVLILLKNEDEAFEIMNISVLPTHQRKGVGKKLISSAIRYSKFNKARYLKIATADSSNYQLIFYKSLGFKVQSVKKNYFIENYPNPIFENGIQCKDKVELIYIL
jgi:ribosomal protein S18 acetylase RimI-like enzyme